MEHAEMSAEVEQFVIARDTAVLTQLHDGGYIVFKITPTAMMYIDYLDEMRIVS